MSSYKPRVGDRVRVTMEGEWMDKPLAEYDARFALTATLPDDMYLRRRKVISIEKAAAPLPVTPGSIIRVDWSRNNAGRWRYYTLSRKGWWRTHDRCRLSDLPAARAAERIPQYPVEVLFDAGAV